MRGHGTSYPFEPRDAPVDLGVGDAVRIDLHAIGNGEIGVLAVKPLVGRLTREESASVRRREGPVADVESDASLARAPASLHPFVVDRTGNALLVAGVEKETATYGFRGGDWTLEGAFVFEDVIAEHLTFGDRSEEPREILGVCGADAAERGFFEGLEGRELASPIFVMAHPWQDEGRCLSFVAARRARYVAAPPRATVDALFAALHRLDGVFEYRLARCELTIVGAEIVVVATLRDGDSLRLEPLPLSLDEEGAMVFGRVLHQILDPAAPER